MEFCRLRTAAMAGLFRSVCMSHVRLLMNEESAPDTIRALGGQFSKLHIVDDAMPETEFYKKFKMRVVDCNTWERKLEALRKIMALNDVKAPTPDIQAEADFKPSGDVLEFLQSKFDPIDTGLTSHLSFKKQHTQLINEQIERAHVLKMCKDELQFDRSAQIEERNVVAEGMERPLMEDEGAVANSICGALPKEKQILFKRMMFRMSKGNAICRFSPIGELVEDPSTGEATEKVVFSILFVGQTLARRIKKICSLSGASVYEVPDNVADLDEQLRDIREKLQEYKAVLDKTNQRISTVLNEIAYTSDTASPLVNWETLVRQERMVCEVLRKCKVLSEAANGGVTISCEGWIPHDEADNLSSCVLMANPNPDQRAVLQMLDTPGVAPPTYFKTNKYTSVYQSIVNTYGIPRYGEVNPGLFTIVTFPFLFGIMYGDMFHGSCLIIASSLMIFFEKSLIKQRKMGEMGEIFGMAFGGRYMLILMGCFAVYCGTIYNDVAAVPTNMFGSKWTIVEGEMADETSVSGVYPWGVDPYWYHTTNELFFFNSLKMKLSVIIGVIQMCFGIGLGAINDIHFGHYSAIVFEALPRMLFMVCTFGYMVFLIITKWFIDWNNPPLGPESEPPNLVTTMIGMFLSPGNVDMPMYQGQETIQLILFAIAVVCVPTMLLAMPLIRRSQNAGAAHYAVVPAGADDEDAHQEPVAAGGHGHGSGPYDFGEDMINNVIHTIEFVLGAVSNTASYLRLWALSLAHAELSRVFWEKMMLDYGLGLVELGPISAVVGVSAWAAATTAVLLLMDVLECFLHALRLHWVEFQNKFFHGDGYEYEPFQFVTKDSDE